MNLVLEELNIKRCTSNHGVYIWEYKGNILLINLSIDDILVAIVNDKAAELIYKVLSKFFKIKVMINSSKFIHLN